MVDNVSQRECDIKHESLQQEVEGMKGWLSKIDNRLWAFGVGLVMLLLTGVGNMLLHFYDKTDANAIAQQVVTIMKAAK